MILHPAVVKWFVKDKCKDLERNKQKHLSYVKEAKVRRDIMRLYNGFIKREREHYSTVKVVCTKNGWVLSYGGKEPSQTGPFDTVDEAVAWFLNGGR